MSRALSNKSEEEGDVIVTKECSVTLSELSSKPRTRSKKESNSVVDGGSNLVEGNGKSVAEKKKVDLRTTGIQVDIPEIRTLAQFDFTMEDMELAMDDEVVEMEKDFKKKQGKRYKNMSEMKKRELHYKFCIGFLENNIAKLLVEDDALNRLKKKVDRLREIVKILIEDRNKRIMAAVKRQRELREQGQEDEILITDVRSESDQVKGNLEKKSDMEKHEGTGKSDQETGANEYESDQVKGNLEKKSDTEKPEGTGQSEQNKENLENKSDTEKPEGTGKSEQNQEKLENKSDTEKPEGTGKSEQNKENLENKSDTEKSEGTGKSDQEKDNLENKSDTVKTEGTGKSEPEKENLENKSDTENAATEQIEHKANMESKSDTETVATKQSEEQANMQSKTDTENAATEQIDEQANMESKTDTENAASEQIEHKANLQK